MSFLLLMAAFLFTGGMMVTHKGLVELGFGPHNDLYELVFYGTPMILGGLTMLSRRQKSTPSDRSIGICMGISGTLSVLFMLLALEQIPGIVAFPIRNLGSLVATAIVSIIVWKERLSGTQWIGIVLSLAAIWLIY